jgi:hypothetical protein
MRRPSGFGSTRDVTLIWLRERALGVPAAARNWRTVLTLGEMARAKR